MRYEIPLTEGPQEFSVSLGGAQYTMTIVFREADGGGWFLDMVRADGSGAVRGIPLVVGSDLLAQHQYKHFGHLYAVLDGGAVRVPTWEDMGSVISLQWEAE